MNNNLKVDAFLFVHLATVGNADGYAKQPRPTYSIYLDYSFLFYNII